MITVTQYTDKTLTMRSGSVLRGSTICVQQATIEDVERWLQGIRYPALPDVEIVTLPFLIYDDNGTEIAGVNENDGKTVYLSAINLEIPKAKRDVEYLALWAHELGHVVHLHRMPFCPIGMQPLKEWQVFQQVHGVTLANADYKTSALHEAFAEAWRLCFSPNGYPHRMALTIPEGMREWMLSLDGSLALRPDHGKAYKAGEVYQLDLPPRIENDRTLVPLRFISEQLGNQVDWDGESIIIKGVGK